MAEIFNQQTPEVMALNAKLTLSKDLSVGGKWAICVLSEGTSAVLTCWPRLAVSNKRGGAVVACWAHNPEVGGSKPPSATYNF